MEHTLILLKPDAMQRGLAGEIITRFERVGLKIVGAKMLQPDYEHYEQHYEGIGSLRTRRGQQAYDVTLAMMQLGPVIAMVLEGVGAVDQVRKMVGATEPKSAQPGTIRGDFSHISFDHANSNNLGIANLIHASADVNEATKEIAHWFKEDELFDYSVVHEKYTQPKGK
jgi:nucleoside-diphosphate kinase